ncbi:RNA-guided endonuclease TnpB family protein [Ligilactobacillus salivarius]|uniref:RNA-guided endonuclease TnpB family protein n=2 Tax=Ligilactobacillus salivarius TaxID=1624 RepID=UPI000668CBE3|nr:RNA-guided endonuclease TnpB family protein [Ligilactobacillus salivarius]MBD5789724.1 IS200/IS605 family element transposase accessory protein TnpB [Ligilactobacillus salivarius]QXL49041.1 transposase [Ligilactobacillus salivarius]QXL50576.1 transposase [Ligilactobacillus salivarius]UHL93770.1 transposase [Ligilactobacillus salivarius]
MEQTVNIKVKLNILEPNVGMKFSKTMEQYRLACNYVSEYLFNNNFPLNKNEVQKVIYNTIREKFNLKSQMTISCIRSVIARYKTVKTQMARRPYKYQDQNTGEWYREVRDLTWLHKPISFNRPQVDLQRNRDWSYLSSGQLSINTLDGRVKVDPICRGFNQYLDGTWKFGLAKLLKSSGKWYLHISATKEVTDFDKQAVKHVVGIDRGLRFLVTSYDEQGKTAFFDGQAIMRKRAKYQKLRAILQAKGTKSAKRRLKKLSGRENRWISDVNHCLSKTLVQKYGANTLFVLENLNGVSFERTDLPKALRNQNKSWAFYQLEQFLTYKAHLNNSEVVEVSAKYTSQRCPKCGVIKKDNRNHEKHEYHCDNCGYRSNDDRIGAMNIQLLGTQYISGQEQPKFELATNA